jgi:hypothetical protein
MGTRLQDETILPITNYASPYYAAVPSQSQPTEVLSRRFELWRQIIKSLIQYFKSTSVANNQFSMINNNVVDTVNFPFFTSLKKTAQRGDVHDIKDPLPENLKKQSFFANFGSGSIQDIQILFKKYHLNMAQQQMKIVHELETKIIPRLEELQRDLLQKIREIKNLNGDFRNNMDTEIAISGQLLDDYLASVKSLKSGNESKLTSKTDPFLLRLKFELQLKQQLHQENYLEEAYINLQITGLELEKIIYKEVQSSLNQYSELISQEIFVMYNDLINELHEGIISKKAHFEWDQFIERDSGKNLLKLKHDDDVPIPRKISAIQYPYSKDLISKTIRSGYLLKKSKILKSYTKSFFILTMNYLHEFKSHNLFENIQPINSIKLNDCILTESNEIKFQLHVNSSMALKSHNYVFKRITEEMTEIDFRKWIMDLKNLTSFNNLSERASFLQRKVTHSDSNTPKFEVPNPMESMDVQKKLQEFSLMPTQSPVAKSPKLKPISQPLTNQIPRVPSVSSIKKEQSLPKLQVPVVPVLQIQSPTPTHGTAAVSALSQVDEQPELEHAHHGEHHIHFTLGNGSSSSLHGPERSVTPVIGDLQSTNRLHIDLSEPLYRSAGGDDLEKMIDSIRP